MTPQGPENGRERSKSRVRGLSRRYGWTRIEILVRLGEVMLIFDNSRPVSCQNLQKVNRNNIWWWCPTTHMCWCPPTTSCGGVHPPHHVVVSTHPHVLVSTHHIMWWCPPTHMCRCSPTTSCGGVRPATCAGAMNLSPWGVKQIFHHPDGRRKGGVYR